MNARDRVALAVFLVVSIGLVATGAAFVWWPLSLISVGLMLWLDTLLWSLRK